MTIDGYTERGYDDGAYIVIEALMADGTKRTIKLEEDDEIVGGVLIKVMAS